MPVSSSGARLDLGFRRRALLNQDLPQRGYTTYHPAWDHVDIADLVVASVADRARDHDSSLRAGYDHADRRTEGRFLVFRLSLGLPSRVSLRVEPIDSNDRAAPRPLGHVTPGEPA